MHMARDCVDRVVGDTSVVAKVYGIAKRLLPPTKTMVWNILKESWFFDLDNGRVFSYQQSYV